MYYKELSMKWVKCLHLIYLKLRTSKKKELNKQHISNFLCISLVFLLLKSVEERCRSEEKLLWNRESQFILLCTWSLGKQFPNFTCLSDLCDGIPAAPLECSQCSGFLQGRHPCVPVSHRGVLEHLSLCTILHLKWLFWFGAEFWTFYCFFYCCSHCAVLCHRKVTTETLKPYLP